MHVTTETAKTAARTLRDDLAAQDVTITHSAALELVAHQLGLADWNTASAVLGGQEGSGRGTGPDHGPGAGLGVPVPVLRVRRFDDARAFYLDFLGFSVEWEHRFEPGMPLYVRLVRDRTRLDLSEHHGDGTPGSAVWIPVADIVGLHTELIGKEYPSARPGVDQDAPGGPTIEVIDPSGNTLRLCGTT